MQQVGSMAEGANGGPIYNTCMQSHRVDRVEVAHIIHSVSPSMWNRVQHPVASLAANSEKSYIIIVMLKTL